MLSIVNGTLIVTYCVEKEVVNCLKSLRCLLLLLQQLANPDITTGNLVVLQFKIMESFNSILFFTVIDFAKIYPCTVTVKALSSLVACCQITQSDNSEIVVTYLVYFLIEIHTIP